MTEYDNNNRGALWKNDRKQSEKHPDLSGSIMIDGKEFWVSGWNRKPGQTDRAPEVSLSVRPKDYKDSQPAPSTAPQQAQNIDDEIPW
jgi:hypothetical protein